MLDFNIIQVRCFVGKSLLTLIEAAHELPYEDVKVNVLEVESVRLVLKSFSKLS